MKRFLLCLLALICVFSVAACRKENPEKENEQPGEQTFSPDVPSFDYAVIYHYRKNEQGVYESLDDCAEYAPLYHSVWDELVREIGESTYLPTDTAFDYTEYYEINFYRTAGGISQYALAIDRGGTLNLERRYCKVASGTFSFEKLGEYFRILQSAQP